jgi:heat shock protein HslJ
MGTLTGRRGAARIGAALLVVALVGACGDDEPESDSTPDATSESSPDATPATLDAAALAGTSYTSTSVEGHELVAGSAVEVTFTVDTMSVWAGCNTLFGPFALDDDSVLSWTAEPAATMMACEPELQEQDQWLAELLTSGVTASSEDGSLTLEGEGVTIVLEAAPTDDLTILLGHTWTAIGTVADGAVSRLPVNTRRPRLDVGADGLSRVFTGCRSGRVRVQVEETTLVFSNLTLQRGRCSSGAARKTDRAVVALLDGPSDNAELHEHLLVVTRGGEGLFFEIR